MPEIWSNEIELLVATDTASIDDHILIVGATEGKPDGGGRPFRTRSLVIITTLLGLAGCAATEIADLFRRRWDAEINLRSIKIVLQMDPLRSKTPHRVRNEFWMHLLAYNLICRAMAPAALRSGAPPWHISFKGTLQTLNHFLAQLGSATIVNALCEGLVACIAAHVVGDRPDRYEPRVRKRRPKEYDPMNKPRTDYKKQMA